MRIVKLREQNRYLMKYFVVAAFYLGSLNALSQDFDILIVNGKLVDGTGNSWRYADVWNQRWQDSLNWKPEKF